LRKVGFVELEELANEIKLGSSLQHSKFSLFDDVDHRCENRCKSKSKNQKSRDILERHPMLQAPIMPTASPEPNVTILRNHSILSDIFMLLIVTSLVSQQLF
jgi:hypothetical protein